MDRFWFETFRGGFKKVHVPLQLFDWAHASTNGREKVRNFSEKNAKRVGRGSIRAQAACISLAEPVDDNDLSLVVPVYANFRPAAHAAVVFLFFMGV